MGTFTEHVILKRPMEKYRHETEGRDGTKDVYSREVLSSESVIE